MTTGLSESRLARLSEFVDDGTALHFPRERWDELGRKVCSAAEEFGFDDEEAFISWLLSSTLTREQMEILASRLTISETYFWREPHSFEALEEHILPGLIRSREKGDRRLRIWSAGCSTGEEPYSIAIAVRRLLPVDQDWRVSILATDINPRILRSAKAGSYGKWSFRGVPVWLKKRYFRRHGDDRWEILPEIRKMVSFAYLNLADDVYPSPLNDTLAMDIVFCRNVLMYFSPERATRVGRGLHASLVDGGWLMVGACELSQQIFPQFAPVNFPGAVVYRKGTREFRPPETFRFEVIPATPPFRETEDTPPAESAPPHETTYAEALEVPLPEPDAAAPHEQGSGVPPPAVALSIRELANLGRLPEALAASDAAIAADKVDPGLHYLRATILQEQNNEGEAIASLKRALYLDPDFVPAHFALGNLMLRRGDSRAAKKCFGNVLALLGALGAEDILPEFEGLTAGRFREIVHATIQIGGLA